MELLESIQKSLVEQSEAQGKTLYPSTYRNYITEALYWKDTNEGYLFWKILQNSYYNHGTYDYLAIIKLYLIYGPEVFKLNRGYIDYTKYDSEKNTLTSGGFEYLCKQIEKYGIVRKHSEEFN